MLINNNRNLNLVCCIVGLHHACTTPEGFGDVQTVKLSFCCLVDVVVSGCFADSLRNWHVAQIVPFISSSTPRILAVYCDQCFRHYWCFVVHSFLPICVEGIEIVVEAFVCYQQLLCCLSFEWWNAALQLWEKKSYLYFRRCSIPCWFIVNIAQWLQLFHIWIIISKVECKSITFQGCPKQLIRTTFGTHRGDDRIRKAACSIYRTSTNLLCVYDYVLCLYLWVCVGVSVFLLKQCTLHSLVE